jgi:hypothetical protein
MLHEHQQMILTQSNVREWTHVPIMNTSCSHLHSFWTTSVSSSLATRVTLTWVLFRWYTCTHFDWNKSNTFCLFYVGTCGTPCVGTDRVPLYNRQALRTLTFTVVFWVHHPVKVVKMNMFHRNFLGQNDEKVMSKGLYRNITGYYELWWIRIA